jgi:4-amino-4-deoxy-L-arabinose transferase-like glycosyltransferase
MFYIGALSMIIFGESEFGLRMIFTVIGVSTIILFLAIAREVFTRQKTGTLIASLAIMFSTQYIILIRQARYYSLVMFLTLLATNSLIKFQILSQKNKKLSVTYFISMFLLFQTHYLSFYCVFIAHVFYYSWHFYSRKITLSKIWKEIGFKHPLMILFITTSPWMIAIRGGFDQSLNLYKAILNFPQYFFNLIFHLNRQTPLLLLGFSFWVLSKSWDRINKIKKEVYILLIISISSTVFLVSLLASLELPPSINADFRYALSAFPLLVLILSLGITFIFKKNNFLGLVLLLIFIGTNFLTLPLEKLYKENYWPLNYPRLQPKFYLFEYLTYELSGKYIGPVDAIVSYLDSHGKNGEKIFVSSESNSMFFSLPQFIVDNNHSYEVRNKASMKSDNLLEYHWVIFRSACDIACIFPEEKELAMNILANNFKPINLPVHDYLVQNREEIPYHLFKTPNNDPKVIIYQNLKDI